MALALTALLAACASEQRPRGPAVAWREAYQPFAADSPLRTPLTAQLAIHRHSERMIADLDGACGADPNGPCKYPRLAGAPEPGRFFGEFGVPIYVASPDDRRRTVTCKRFPCGVAGITGEDTRALYGVPIPAGAKPDPSTDGHMVIFDPARAYAWELFRASYDPLDDEWSAEGGIRWSVDGPGVDLPGEPGAAVGAGTSLFGTVVRPDEIRRALDDGTGVIPHVLSGGYDSPRTGCFIGPLAKATDADDGRRWSIPEGAILQLDPAIDLDRLDLTPAARVIARTLQVYGMVIRDDSGAFMIQVENVSAEDGADPGRAGAWEALGLTKDSLRSIRSTMFRVVGWDPEQAHGSNCP